eukprot:scaffold170813_cov38-Prasinocladus_malaysianus.AAC.1
MAGLSSIVVCVHSNTGSGTRRWNQNKMVIGVIAGVCSGGRLEEVGKRGQGSVPCRAVSA